MKTVILWYESRSVFSGDVLWMSLLEAFKNSFKSINTNEINNWLSVSFFFICHTVVVVFCANTGVKCIITNQCISHLDQQERMMCFLVTAHLLIHLRGKFAQMANWQQDTELTGLTPKRTHSLSVFFFFKQIFNNWRMKFASSGEKKTHLHFSYRRWIWTLRERQGRMTMSELTG